MKKSLKFFAALSCAAVMALAFAACSSGSLDSSASGSSSDSGNSESTSASTSDNSESSSSTSSASGKFASVEEYVASEELQSQPVSYTHLRTKINCFVSADSLFHRRRTLSLPYHSHQTPVKHFRSIYIHSS